MEKKTLNAESRDRIKKGAVRKLRAAGRIPAIIYGHTEPKTISIDEHEFNQKFHQISESTIIKLKLNDTSHEVLIRDFQEDILTGRLIHLDFYEIEKGRQLRTNVSVHLEGAPIGVKEGGLLESFVHEVEVECLPKDLPPNIIVDISDLQIGHSIHIGELPAPEGVRILNSPGQVVCTVAHKRIEVPVEAVEEEVEEEAAVSEEEAATAEE